MDWLPTWLAFANVLPKDYVHVTFKTDESKKLPLVLDGYNMYPYIMGTSSSGSNRDHLVFHIKPELSITHSWKAPDISRYSFDQLDELALIFYDENGILWKYLDVEMSSNIIGDPVTNAGFCEMKTSTSFYHTDTTTDDVVLDGIFNLEADLREENNYESFENVEINGDSDYGTDVLEPRILELFDYYVNNGESENPSAKFLYGYFSCLISTSRQTDCIAAAANSNAWVPFLTDDEIPDTIENHCGGMSNRHTIFRLLTTGFEFKSNKFVELIEDNTDNVKELNKYSEVLDDFVGQRRDFEHGMVLDTESDRHFDRNDIEKHVKKNDNNEKEMNGMMNVVAAKKNWNIGIVVAAIVGILISLVAVGMIWKCMNKKRKVFGSNYYYDSLA